MHVIHARNVNDAYIQGLTHILAVGETRLSRAGEVLVAPHPVTTVYECPQERVLFSTSRDANPFFHLFESLWMLAGRNDAKWLDRFVSDFSSRFAEDDGIQHGAYGFRWRNHFDLEGGGSSTLPDQLSTVIGLLRKDPFDRRAVITMWDPVSDLGANKRDIPCNLTVIPRIREQNSSLFLDITVTCRSNDVFWGCYGANAVHFSVLQEYLAAMLCIRVGKYYQISNNFHLYKVHLPKAKAALEETQIDVYAGSDSWVRSIINRPTKFDEDLAIFLSWVESCDYTYKDYANPWFLNTAVPLFETHRLWKMGGKVEALERINNSYSMSPDWRVAVQKWMERRMNKSGQKTVTDVNIRQVGGRHYCTGGDNYQHWDLVAETGMGYFEGQVTKYVSRWRKKNGIQDLQKALHFLEKLITISTDRDRDRDRTHITKVKRFAEAAKLTAVEYTIIQDMVSWHQVDDLCLVQCKIEQLIASVPAEDSNKHADRVGE